MKNSSGFYGYSVATVYPNMGDMMSQTMVTAVDPEEQEALSGIEPEKKVSSPVQAKTKNQVWMVLIGLIAFLFLFGIPKG